MQQLIWSLIRRLEIGSRCRDIPHLGSSSMARLLIIMGRETLRLFWSLSIVQLRLNCWLLLPLRRSHDLQLLFMELLRIVNFNTFLCCLPDTPFTAFREITASRFKSSAKRLNLPQKRPHFKRFRIGLTTSLSL